MSQGPTESADSTGRPPRRTRWRRVLGVSIGLVCLWFIGRPVVFLAWASRADGYVELDVPAGYANDASGLEQTAMLETWPVPGDRQAAVDGLRQLFMRAQAEGLAISIAGSKHSMGGHTIAPGGIRLDMTSFRSMRLDEEAQVLRVGSGAVWSDVLQFLDPKGLSIAIMQSNDSFTVGGSVSVNCHGWQHGLPPISSSVLSFRILLADGQLMECSREQNSELFGLALGGYGLFGVLIDLDLRLVPNELYSTEAVVIESSELGPAFLERTLDSSVGMAAGRVSIAPGDFLETAVLSVLRRQKTDGPPAPVGDLANRGLRRTVFRASVGSAYGKELRWFLETSSARFGGAASTTRNTELAEGVEVYGNHDPSGTDILHEYFVPHATLSSFLEGAKPIFESSPADLLNITVRDIREDEDTFLRYADQGMFGLVMLFHQEGTEVGESAMGELSRDLIDLAHSLGGRHYLPYRLHASRGQFESCYPMAGEFFEAKRRYDPGELFQNQFYLRYGLPVVPDGDH
jgi:FAD/FMN-containing dehydrogenase